MKPGYQPSTSLNIRQTYFMGAIRLMALLLLGQYWVDIQKTSSCHCDLTLSPETTLAQGNDYDYQAGDTICLQAGNWSHLQLRGWRGTEAEPLVFINHGGQVYFTNESHYYGISLADMQHFQLMGNGSSAHQYGIVVDTVGRGNSVTLYDGCSHFEIAHLEMARAQFAGLMAKSEPTCDGRYNRERFTMESVRIHHNYIHHTHGEGMYLGSSFYAGKTLDCDGDSILVFPHEIHDIEVYANLITDTGWDGMQIAGASDGCEVHHNRVIRYGQRMNQYQNAGIQLGGGSRGHCYSNYLRDGSGNGIDLFGLGDTYVYNNVILSPGKDFFPHQLEKRSYGIFCSDATTVPGSRYVFVHNTIIRPKTDGIRVYSVLSRENYIANNVIIDPGGWDKYAQDGIQNTRPEDSYIYTLNDVEVEMEGNFFSRDIHEAGLLITQSDTPYLSSSSPLINSGADVQAKIPEITIHTDFHNQPRRLGPFTDIGACEDTSYAAQILSSERVLPIAQVFPNPTSRWVNIHFLAIPEPALQVKILTINGQQKYEGIINGEQYRIDMQGWPAGYYLIWISDGQQSKAFKVLKRPEA